MYASSFALTVNGTTVYLVPTNNGGQYRVCIAFPSIDDWGWTYNGEAFIGHVNVGGSTINACARYGYSNDTFTLDEAIAHILSDRANWICEHGDSSARGSGWDCDWCGHETERVAITGDHWWDGSPVVSPVWVEGPMRADGSY